MVAGVMAAILAGRPSTTFQSDAGYWLYTLKDYLVPIDDLAKEQGFESKIYKATNYKYIL